MGSILRRRPDTEDGVSVLIAASSPPRRREDCRALFSAKNIQGVSEVLWVRRLELHPVPRSRVRKSELMRVQPLASETEPGRQRGVSPVERITCARMPVCRHMHSDLVSAARLEVYLEQRRSGESLKCLVMRH